MKKLIKYICLVLVFICITGCGCSKKIKDTTEVSVIPNKSVSSFIKYDGEIYYWKLNSLSRLEEGLYGDYYEMPYFASELVKINKNGTEELILKDVGTGKIAIENNRIYFNRLASEEGGHNTYCYNIVTRQIKLVGAGVIQYVSGGKIYGYIDDASRSGIFSIDTTNDKYSVISSTDYLVTANDDYLIYSNYSNPDKLSIRYIKGDKIKKIMSIKSSDFSGDVTSLEIEKADIIDGKIELYVGYRDGSSASLQELIKYTSKLDGSKLKKEIVNYDTEIISNDIVKIGDNSIYYTIGKDKKDIITLNEFYTKYNLNSEYDLKVYQESVIGSDIYFILDYSNKDYDYKSGREQYYKRIKTMYFRYNINSKELIKFYEF